MVDIVMEALILHKDFEVTLTKHKLSCAITQDVSDTVSTRRKTINRHETDAC
jgi:hypothetical protein